MIDPMKYSLPRCGYDERGYLLISRDDWDTPIRMSDGSEETHIHATWDPAWQSDFFVNRSDIRATELLLPANTWVMVYLYRIRPGAGLSIFTTADFKESKSGERANRQFGKHNWLYVGTFRGGHTSRYKVPTVPFKKSGE